MRIVAATNQDLQLLVSQGKFRLDLFYRVNVIPVRLPTLQERPEDIRHLVRYYLNQINQSYQRNVSISAEALERLAAYDWPGNVRQLRNVLERLALLAESRLIGAAEVNVVVASESQNEAAVRPPPAPLSPPHMPPPSALRAYQPVQSDEREHIVQALVHSHGNKSRAAQNLGLTLRQLNYRIQRLGIA